MILLILIGIALEGTAALWALRWALPRSNQAFFSVFLGDALLRLAGLALVTGWLWFRHLPFVQPLLAVGFGYLATSLIQIPFLSKARYWISSRFLSTFFS